MAGRRTPRAALRRGKKGSRPGVAATWLCSPLPHIHHIHHIPHIFAAPPRSVHTALGCCVLRLMHAAQTQRGGVCAHSRRKFIDYWAKAVAKHGPTLEQYVRVKNAGAVLLLPNDPAARTHALSHCLSHCPCVCTHESSVRVSWSERDMATHGRVQVPSRASLRFSSMSLTRRRWLTIGSACGVGRPSRPALLCARAPARAQVRRECVVGLTPWRARRICAAARA